MRVSSEKTSPTYPLPIGFDDIGPLDFHACADRDRFTVARDDSAPFKGLDDTDESIRGSRGAGSDQYQRETKQVDNREPHGDLLMDS